MTEKAKIAGWFYWKPSPFGLAPEAQRYVAGCGAPEGAYLEKYPLSEEQMRVPLDKLMRDYPAPPQ